MYFNGGIKFVIQLGANLKLFLSGLDMERCHASLPAVSRQARPTGRIGQRRDGGPRIVGCAVPRDPKDRSAIRVVNLGRAIEPPRVGGARDNRARAVAWPVLRLWRAGGARQAPSGSASAGRSESSYQSTSSW